MPKIKPFIWELSGTYIYISKTPFGNYSIAVHDDRIDVRFGEILAKVQTLNEAKRFAFNDFKRRLEETLGEQVGYDLPIDENC
jgi:hypothetical protein